MHALCVKASLTEIGGIKLAAVCKHLFFFFFLRWNLKNDAVLVSHLKKMNKFFPPEDGIYTKLKTGYDKSRIIGGAF